MNQMNRKIKEAFDQVTAETELKQRTADSVIHYMRKKNEKQKITKFPRKRAISLTLVLVFVFVLSGLFLYQQPVSAISVDSTSSVEVYFNRLNRVVEVTHYDENGNPTSGSHDLQHKNFDQAMEELLRKTESEEVYITVASHSEETTTQLINNLSQHQAMMEEMHIFHSSEDIMQLAQESGTPMGRMHAMHELEKWTEDFSRSNIESESTQELMENFERHHREMMEEGHMHRQNGPRNGGPMDRRR